MRRGGSKVKGGQYEKKIAKKVGLWYCDDDLALYKSQSSGGRVRVLGDTQLHPGDIIPIKKKAISFPICIECKKVEPANGWRFESIPNPNERDILIDYWKQAVGESGKFIPWLVFSRNREIDFLGICPRFRKHFIENLKGLGYIRVLNLFYIYSLDAVLERLHFREVNNAAVILGGRSKPLLCSKRCFRNRCKNRFQVVARGSNSK